MDYKRKVDTLALKRLRVFNERSDEVLFSQLHSDGKTTFIFLRHFGCIACRAHVIQIMTEVRKGKIKTPVVFIGNGHSSIITAFKEDLNILDAEIYTDPHMKTFDACGFNRGLTYLVNAASVKKMYLLSKQGHTQGKMKSENGSHRQMGGVMVLSRVGEVLFHYCSEHLGDFPEEENFEAKAA